MQIQPDYYVETLQFGGIDEKKLTLAQIGDGESPVPGDTVRVHYTGWLDGFESDKKFDSSYDRRSPLVFKVIIIFSFFIRSFFFFF